ncbi:MAG: Glycyl-tRNA synthetase beta chain [uncultured Sphingomonas sp.]|uniref:Glycine--tRNA ligase beta subunit n=1 Tax=uncultured Sphingomonas sp. TaxID=158754 RepID=A0A6J4SY09_9SPHN|nr:glycine--tRNA ligase subunit beta [uncultured Sphingomonas sp.]CAA9508217.1 MAG: Glycyl-tRNA synthetase beta chain [uncultured Sphingomonas sp.]
MSTADFLLELLSEEVPARMQAGARNSLARMFAEELDKAGLRAEAIETFATPRRLALIARGLPVATAAAREELKGPRASAPPQALEGFLRKTGLAREQLVERDGVFYAVIDKPGQATSAVLGPAIERIVRGFPWPKSMRWGAASASTASLRWVRPLHGIVALLGDEIVPVEVDGTASGATTVGHRFHHPGPITLAGASDYAEKLRACHVIVDQDERAAIIRDGARALADGAGLDLVEDEGLVAENAGLTEWPVPLLGRFDADYLDVPPEVIQLTARVNQKYFVLRGDEGALADAFICTANIAANDDGAAIVEGNQRVLAARLADARFFWEQDLKVPLQQQAAKLGQVVFHEKLGTVADKVERVAKLARWLVEEGVVKGADPDQAERAARLAKADLVTGMVGEFPELQGVIGGYLAERQGEPKAVADAVRDHYGLKARNGVPAAVALADRIDNVRSFFSIGEKPTGSRDPFAVRRAGLGIVYYVLVRSYRLNLRELLGPEAFEFMVDRWKFQNREAGGRPDFIDAVIAVSSDGDLARLGARMEALQSFVQTEDGANLVAGYKRAANILKKENWSLPRVMAGPGEQAMPQTGEEDPLVLVEEPAIAEAVREMAQGSAAPDDAPPEEQALVAALDEAEPRAEAAVEAEDFRAAMSALASLRQPIDAFFDKVTVNDPAPQVRARRLNLLARFRDAVHRVADFSSIEG